MKVRSHKFHLGKYRIKEGRGWVGRADVPDNYNTLRMEVLTGRSVEALACQIHEALHAEGCKDAFLHRAEGDPCENIARFLVRMGWERKVDSAAEVE